MMPDDYYREYKDMSQDMNQEESIPNTLKEITHYCTRLEEQIEVLKADNARLRTWLRRIAEWQVVWAGKVLPIKSIKRMALDALEGK